MNCEQTLEVLSCCGLAAVLTDGDGAILLINGAGDRLLHGGGALRGKKLSDLAPELCAETGETLYANIAFGEYLARCPAPETEGLPPGARLIVFRDATKEAIHDMLISVLNQMKESVVLCDAHSRVYHLSDAAVGLDSMVTQDVLGEPVSKVYTMLSGEELAIPRVIQSRQPLLNHRHNYRTRYGKEVTSVANTYPIVQHGQVLGAFNILEDYTQIDSLHKQIIDLREKLLEPNAEGKRAGGGALRAKYEFRDIIHISDSMRSLIARCRQLARTNSSVMIYGETGTGKELIAQSIHNASPRAAEPFLAINCAAIPEALLEGLLFGTEKGAYTGAESRAGLFEQANHGTLLLDEINSMDIGLQSKLLRVLQEGSFLRVGGSQPIRVDLRILSNVNIPPRRAVEEGKLRQDLFYRLGVVIMTLPPLRSRREDIPLLVKYFIIQGNRKLGRTVKGMDDRAMKRLEEYDWPGNVRELEHCIEHAMNIMPDEYSEITADYLPEHILSAGGPTLPTKPEAAPKTASARDSIREMEYAVVCDALKKHGGNISRAAWELQMSRQNLQYRIKRYQIDLESLLRGDS